MAETIRDGDLGVSGAGGGICIGVLWLGIIGFVGRRISRLVGHVEVAGSCKLLLGCCVVGLDQLQLCNDKMIGEQRSSQWHSV